MGFAKYPISKGNEWDIRKGINVYIFPPIHTHGGLNVSFLGLSSHYSIFVERGVSVE